MRVRIVGVLVVMVALLAACGSSSSSKPADTTPAAETDVDVQAAQACKAMEAVLTATANGDAVSGADATKMRETSDRLVRTPDGRQPAKAEEVPKWYPLGSAQVELLAAVGANDSASVTDLTTKARALCVTIPASAQQTAKYTPVTA
jgi:hypothetical protein